MSKGKDGGDIWSQLILLRRVSEMGLLHEAQKLQLQYWPRLFFGWSTKSEFTFDPERKLIEFRLTAKKVPLKGVLQTPLKLFGVMVKKLLGEVYRVRVKVGTRVLMDEAGVVKPAILRGGNDKRK